MNADTRDVLFLAILAVVGAWLVWNLRNLGHLYRGVRWGTWRKPMWWTCLCSVSLFTGFLVWTLGLFSGGPFPEEACPLQHHENYGGDYVESRAEEKARLFPLHNRCNDHYDLVPVWVNPTVVICALVAALSIAVLLWFAARSVLGRKCADNRCDR